MPRALVSALNAISAFNAINAINAFNAFSAINAINAFNAFSAINAINAFYALNAINALLFCERVIVVARRSEIRFRVPAFAGLRRGKSGAFFDMGLEGVM